MLRRHHHPLSTVLGQQQLAVLHCCCHKKQTSSNNLLHLSKTDYNLGTKCLTLSGSSTLFGYGSWKLATNQFAPSTGKIWPVMFAAAPLNKNTVAFATSFVCPTLPKGNGLWFGLGASFEERRLKPSVSPMGPGEMTLERTPWGPSSTAITRERASTAAFAADTCTWYGVPKRKAGGETKVELYLEA